MDRQIKFRGKELGTGKWVYGDLLHPATSCRIINYTETEENGALRADYHYHDVDPETVGQFTGLYDRNGKEVYEGDIVVSSVIFTNEEDEERMFWRVGEIRYSTNRFVLTNCTNYDNKDLTLKSDTQPSKKTKNDFPTYRSKVISNVHDNPDLLNAE